MEEKTFGERLKKLRKEANITQNDFADKLLVHSQTVSRWERGLIEPDISQLGEIAAAFSIEESEVAFLLGSSRMPLSLQSDKGDEEEGGRTLMDTIASGEGEEELLDKLQLKTALEALSERDRKIIFLRYFRDKTQSEVAGMIGVSQVQISRIESRILKDFKERMSTV